MKKIKMFLSRFRHAWIMIYWIIYLIWFNYLENDMEILRTFHVMHTTLDDKIPFCVFFVVPYLLWFVYIAAAIIYFMLVDKDDYYRLCAFLFSGMTICLFICSVFPNGTDLRPVINPHENIFYYIVNWIYTLDTCTNVFPSIHVFNSIGVHIALARSTKLAQKRYGRLVKNASRILSVLICASTLFLKQHSVLDVSGAIILASLIYGFVYGYPVFQESRTNPRSNKLHAVKERY